MNEIIIDKNPIDTILEYVKEHRAPVIMAVANPVTVKSAFPSIQYSEEKFDREVDGFNFKCQFAETVIDNQMVVFVCSESVPVNVIKLYDMWYENDDIVSGMSVKYTPFIKKKRDEAK